MAETETNVTNAEAAKPAVAVRRPVVPSKVAMAQRRREEKPAGGKPAGWWQIRDVSGSLAGVTSAVEANTDIPDHWKTAIKADLALRCVDGFNFVYLDAHFHVEKGNAVLHYHAVPDKKLL